jgi:hypothetical protein
MNKLPYMSKQDPIFNLEPDTQLSSRKKATTIKLDTDRYDQFKILGIRNHFTLQSFCEACVELYLNSSSFQSVVNEVAAPSAIVRGEPFKL